ncbi:hypothetical protein JIN77_05315 [Verrucomicrobiaceae bacterium R5-34]|nr:hypothetical protein [Verrucomicrobiaceae bacterium R5-34]
MPDHILRAFNQTGRDKWTEYIDSLKIAPDAPLPSAMLTDKVYLAELPLDLPLKQKLFETKYELAEYLHPILEALIEHRVDDVTFAGIWDWLGAFYFDSICPVKNGKRSLREKARYVYDCAWNRKYRHRIAEPCGLYRRHMENSKIFLYGPPSQISDMEEQASSRLAINSNKDVAKAMMRLYWDANRGKPKSKAADTKREPGTLRRFSDLLLQLERTYDLESIGFDGIIELLPKREYQAWLETA